MNDDDDHDQDDERHELSDGYPPWVRLKDVWDRGHQYACRRHGVVFVVGDGPCVECIRAPALPACVVRPEYWYRREHGIGSPQTNETLTWTCEHHGASFTDAQGCKACLVEDGFYADSRQPAPGFDIATLAERMYG